MFGPRPAGLPPNGGGEARLQHVDMQPQAFTCKLTARGPSTATMRPAQPQAYHTPEIRAV
jgi:hypothetical protein